MVRLIIRSYGGVFEPWLWNATNSYIVVVMYIIFSARLFVVVHPIRCDEDHVAFLVDGMWLAKSACILIPFSTRSLLMLPALILINELMCVEYHLHFSLMPSMSSLPPSMVCGIVDRCVAMSNLCM